MVRDRHAFRSGAGRMCLDFVRTLRYRDRADIEEELSTPARLAAWVDQFGPCDLRDPAGREVSPEPARELREAIYAALVAATGSGSCLSSHRDVINEWAARPGPAPVLGVDGRVSYRAGDPVEATLALVARDALDLIAGPDLSRVRRCANPDCNIMFVDTSRPRQRRWCSMATCGNRAKKINQRARSA
jgi:predicted RNA-binding Zn ribbon-like protein